MSVLMARMSIYALEPESQINSATAESSFLLETETNMPESTQTVGKSKTVDSFLSSLRGIPAVVGIP